LLLSSDRFRHPARHRPRRSGRAGEHKLSRGYRPVATYSAHEFADGRMQRAVADYLASERPAVAEAIEEYAERLPFRRGEAESE